MRYLKVFFFYRFKSESLHAKECAMNILIAWRDATIFFVACCKALRKKIAFIKISFTLYEYVKKKKIKNPLDKVVNVKKKKKTANKSIIG